jgi:hypothetical protein
MSEVTVRVTLRPSEQGGRREPILPLRDYSCVAHFRDVPRLAGRGYDCRLLVSRLGEQIGPGQTVEGVGVAFLSPTDVFPHLTVGTQFDLWEGRTIGHAEVTAIRDIP